MDVGDERLRSTSAAALPAGLELSTPSLTLRRRSFLQVGALGLAGLGASGWSLDQLLRTEARAAVLDPAVVRGKSVVFLFLHGGPSQIETFDPKGDAPVEIRSATGEVSTRLPGITFGGTLPKLAGLADRLTVVRSFVAGNGNHDIKPIVGPATGQANLGSIYARLAGGNDPNSGMPTNVALFPRAVDPDAGPEQLNFGRFDATGQLGSAVAPFIPGGSGELQTAMKLALPRERFDDRRSLIAALDGVRRSFESNDAQSALDAYQRQAFETILGGVSEAFDLQREAPRLIARYDTAPLVRPDQIDKKWTNYKHYVDHNRTLGKLMLMARRLCEAGTRFVTVTTNFVWDNHADQNNAGAVEGMRYCSVALDQAVSAFLEDVHERGLSDKILLVVVGEMGRTPRINARGGRDHWGGLAPLLLAGGGLPMGRVVGQSTRDGGGPRSEPITIPHLVSTIFHTLFDIPRLRLRADIPAEVARVVFASDPIPGL